MLHSRVLKISGRGAPLRCQGARSDAPRTSVHVKVPSCSDSGDGVCSGACFGATPYSALMLMQICGVTNVADAELAVKQGADFVGMILWPKAKRSIDDSVACSISESVSLPLVCNAGGRGG
jgi:hypothetical protein